MDHTLDQVKKIVCSQNARLKENNLVILTEGNVSQITQDRKYVIIKPSGVSYDKMRPEHMMIVDMNGKVYQGNLKPSVDTPIHLEIYKKFPSIFGIVHTHSPYATMFAQACEEIPCNGTTHADNFNGPIPVTGKLTRAEINSEYEKNIGKSMIKVINLEIPAVLVSGHGTFTFGHSAHNAVDNMLVLEKVAMMAVFKNPSASLDKNLLKKHYNRKHGPDSYYGQKK